MLMKIHMNKIKLLLLAGLLFMMGVQPAAVLAAPSSVEVNIPVSTVYTKDGPKPEAGNTVVTEFRLEAIDDAPLPALTELRITGEGKANFGEMSYDAPGDYYYRLTSELIEGERCELRIKDPTIIWVSITQSDEGLVPVVKAYPSMDHANADQGKRDTVQEIVYNPIEDEDTEKPGDIDTGDDSEKPGDTNKPNNPNGNNGNNGSNNSGSNVTTGGSQTTGKGQKPSTAAVMGLELWVWIGLSALIVLILASRKLSQDESNR